MKPNEKQKMCPNCDGRIPVEAETCIYCSADLGSDKVKNSFQGTLFEHQSIQDSLTSLYTPPYGGKRTFEEPVSQVSHPAPEPRMNAQVQEQVSEGEKANSMWPTVMLVAGSNFLLLGLLQLFFAEDGVLKLEWNGSYWFIYCLAALPLLFFGFKKIQDLRD